MKKEVIIKRRNYNKRINPEVMYDTKASIGATLTKSGIVNTGLTKEEEKKIMPRLIGVEYNDLQFNQKLKDFFSSLTIKIPWGEEVKLNVTVDDDGFPEDYYDYIKYKFALVNPDVAVSKEKAIGNKKFYIEDKGKEEKKKYEVLSVKKDAYKEFIKISADEDKINMLLNVIGVKHENLSKEQKEVELEKVVNDTPDKFLEHVKDKNLEIRSFINECISGEVLQKVGNSILDGDVVIGDTIEEAILFLKNKKNSDVFVRLKARMNAFTHSK